MGRIFDKFGQLQFHNEAEVSQNFVIPLFLEFLGYSLAEILPERQLPGFDFPLNREKVINSQLLDANIRPDYIIALDGDITRKIASIDSKGPKEKLDNHLRQLISYCIALETNLITITNGTEFRLYDANELIFRTENIEELDTKFGHLRNLLHRIFASKSLIERFQLVDPSYLQEKGEGIRQEQSRRIMLANSDFRDYLQKLSRLSESLDLPVPVLEAFRATLHRLPGEDLLSFVPYDRDTFRYQEDPLKFSTIEAEIGNRPILLIGESGIGKSSLLQEMASNHAQECLLGNSDVIPVLVKLGQYTINRNLFDLIFDALVSHDANVRKDDIPALLRDGRLFLFFDAFDEIFDSYTHDVERELQSLLDSYPNCRFVVTTRHFRLPKLRSIKPYAIGELSHESMHAFAKMYLGNDATPFLDQVFRKGLGRIASNTLILTFLILIFDLKRELPSSRSKVLQTVVDHVEAWNQTKAERFDPGLSSSVIKTILCELAFSVFTRGQNYTLDLESVESVLLPTINDLEIKRQVPAGIEFKDIFDNLASTGFIAYTDEGIAFWHRSIMEYFAAKRVLSFFEENPDLIAEYIQRSDWEYFFPLLAWVSSDQSAFISTINQYNVFIAAQSTIECNLIGGDGYKRATDSLVDKCKSKCRPVRKIAVQLLEQLKGDYVDNIFHRILEDPGFQDIEYDHIRKTALIQIARRQIPDAKDIVYSFLKSESNISSEWWEDDTVETAVIKALAEFDDEESHLQIISIWSKSRALYITEASSSALIKIARRQQISDAVAEALVDLFFVDIEEGISRLNELSKILSEIKNKTIVTRLIESLKNEIPENYYQSNLITHILASYDDSQVVQSLIEKSLNKNLNPHTRSWFAKALAESSGQVPFDVFQKLTHDREADLIRAQAIRGMGKYPFEKISAYVLQAIHPPSTDRLHYSETDFADVQGAAFEVLDKHRQLELLLQPDNQPEYFYSNSLETIFSSISNNQLHSLTPFVVEFIENGLKRVSNHHIARLIIRAAWVLADLGHLDQAQEVIEQIRSVYPTFANGWVLHDIVRGAHRLASSYAMNVIDDALQLITANYDQFPYEIELCIEALGYLGTEEACNKLAQIAEHSAEEGSSIAPESAIRAIEFIGPRDREDWLIDYLDKFPDTNALHRVIDTLGMIGSMKSLPLLKNYLRKTPSERIEYFCFWSIHQIYKRSGLLWFDNQEKSG